MRTWHKLVGFLALPAIFIIWFFWPSAPQYDFPLQRTVEKTVEDITNGTGSNQSVEDFVGETSAPATDFPDTLPDKIRIEVPFIVQAPTGNWDMPYQEACEEASLIMVHHFLQGTSVTPEEADKEILDLVAWENNEFQYSADVTIEEAKRIAEDYFHEWGELFYDFTIEDMKRLLATGHPIIVPLAGRDLHNPYYSGLGPWYHMLVITGYDSTGFITNDVGTRRGEGYHYPYDVLYDAIHNWTGAKEDIHQGRKAMLVLTQRDEFLQNLIQ